MTSLTVTDKLTVRGEELVAGRVLSAAGALVFGDGCQLVIEGDIKNLNPGADGTVVIVTSDVSVSGCPTLARTVANRHWTVAAGEDGRSLVLVYDPLVPAGMIDVRTEWGVKAGLDGVEGNAERFNAALAALPQGSKPQLYFPDGD